MSHLWPNAALWAVVTRGGGLWCPAFSNETQALGELNKLQRDPTKAEYQPFRVVTFLPVEGTIPMEALDKLEAKASRLLAHMVVFHPDICKDECGALNEAVVEARKAMFVA